jgi:hypothetical protein
MRRNAFKNVIGYAGSKSKIPIGFAQFIEKLLYFFIGADKYWEKVLTKLSPDMLIVNLPRSPFFLKMVQTARNMEVKTCLIFHTWKELEANGRIIVPFDYYIVWNKHMKEELIYLNPSIKENNIFVGGSFYYDMFFNDNYRLEKDQFCKSLGIDQSRPYIVYAASNPRAIPSEERVVADIHKLLKMHPELKDHQLIVRLNPMDTGSAFSQLKDKDLILLMPYWNWIPELNWNSASEKDLSLYYNLLKNALCCIGCASTVALDSLAAGCPVINILYDAKKIEEPFLGAKYFWDADFYKVIRTHMLVNGCSSVSEVISAIESLNSETDAQRSGSILQDVITFVDGKSAEHTVAYLEKRLS